MPAPTSQVLLAGTLTTVNDEAPRYPAFVDSGSLYAVWLRDGPAPYLSRIERFDSGSTAWQRVFEEDAALGVMGVDGGRAVVTAYRETGAASSRTFALLDLATGRTTMVDGFSLSAATFHGGGSGPRGPGTGSALGGGRVAWSRINELAGGVTEGELRVAPVADPTRFTIIGRSRITIVPLWIDESTLVYQLGGGDQDEIRTRDLVTGIERLVARVPAPFQDRGLGGIAHSGTLLGWIENLGSTGAALHWIDLGTGTQRDLDLGTSSCFGLSGNALGFAWSCRANAPTAKTLSYFDPRMQRMVDVVRSVGIPSDFRAWEGGFFWFDFVTTPRTANLLIVR